MPPIQIGETLTTEDPKIEITPTREAPLPVGEHIFELVVEDDQQRRSPPVNVRVVVQKTLPEAVLTGPEPVEVGAPFALSAEGSTAVEPAKLVSFHWRLVPSR